MISDKGSLIPRPMVGGALVRGYDKRLTVTELVYLSPA